MHNQEILLVWKEIYSNWFDMEIDISNLQVPENYNPEKHFLVLVDKKIDIELVFTAMKKRFNAVLFEKNFKLLDFNLKNDRSTKSGGYVILFKKNVQADEDLKNMPVDKLIETGHKGIMLLERLLLEVYYYDRTNTHLDTDARTLCAGSPYLFWVPGVSWSSCYETLVIGTYHLNSGNDNLRSRAVIS